MNSNLFRIEQLVEQPGESLAVEIKRWISPDKPEGIAKIARAAIALRNFNGGYIVIGFDNETLEPDSENEPDDIRSMFHIDKIQRIVSKYSSEQFEVSVEFPVREEHSFVVVAIPAGTRTPVAAKADLNVNGKKLVTANDVYVRSLRSNNTPSTTKAQWKDWSDVVEICFENRESDVGRFLRRHLGGITPDAIRELTLTLADGVNIGATVEESLEDYLKECRSRFEQVSSERNIVLPEHGSFEIALIIDEEVSGYSTDQQFLNLIGSSNPDYSGWPIWLDGRGFNSEMRPYVYKNGWEAIMARLEAEWGSGIDFLRMEPVGRFYQYRALEDDFAKVQGSSRAPQPLTSLDFTLPVTRTAEAIAVGIALAKAMGCEREETTLCYSFRWSGLKDRELKSWISPSRIMIRELTAYQNEVTTYVKVPLDTSLSALSEYVNKAIQPLFGVFDGFTLSSKVIEDLTRRLIERRR